VEAVELVKMHGDVADVFAEILTGSRQAEIPDHLARGHGERGNHRPRAMADVLKFAFLRLAGRNRLRGVLTLENLHAGLLVAADDQPSLLVQAGGIDVQPADGLGLGVEIWVVAVEPVNTLVRLEIGLVEDAPDGGAAHGLLMRVVEDSGRQVAEAPTA